MRIGSIEVTLREVLVGVVIALLMTGLGFFIASSIHNSETTKSEEYFKAVKVNDDSELFGHGIDTQVGNMLAYGTVTANEPVSDPRVEGEFFYLLRIEEHYVQKTRTVTYTDGEGKMRTRTEVYWEWEERDRESQHTESFSFLGRDFDYDLVDFGNVSYETTYKERSLSNVRQKFYTIPVKFNGSLFAKAKDGELINTKYYHDKTVEEIIASKEKSADLAVTFFWIFWVILTIAAVVGFVALDNRYLNGRE